MGLGWHIGVGVPGTEEMRFHNGQTGGFHSCVAFDPERGSGIVVLSNTASNWLDTLCIGGMGAITGQDLPFGLPVDIPLSTDALNAYAGTYRAADLDVEVDRVHEVLRMRITGQPAMTLWAFQEDLFFMKSVVGTVTFQRSESQEIVGLRIQQQGAVLEAIRE